MSFKNTVHTLNNLLLTQIVIRFVYQYLAFTESGKYINVLCTYPTPTYYYRWTVFYKVSDLYLTYDWVVPWGFLSL